MSEQNLPPAERAQDREARRLNLINFLSRPDLPGAAKAEAIAMLFEAIVARRDTGCRAQCEETTCPHRIFESKDHG